MKSPQLPTQQNQEMSDNLNNSHNGDHLEELGLTSVKRPTNIENDVSSLGQKKRVSNILTSPYFKEELETAVTDLLRSGQGGGHVIAKEIANFFSPGNRSFQQGNTMLGMKTGIGCVSPINDFSLADASMYSRGEKLLRCKLAALYRIVDLYGWSSTVYNHITVRVSQEQEHFLINPFGLLYHEVSASKLLKINMQGDVLDPGSTTLGYNSTGYLLHSAIHAARPDLHCIIHVHSSDVVAVSAMECGLLPISQEALIVGEVSYHNYHGILVDSKEKKAIQKHLGPNNKVMILRNHGLVACGETVEEAFHYLYFTMLACSAQVKAMSCLPPNKLIQLDRSAMKARTEDTAKKDCTGGKKEGVQWGPGEMLFESLIRMLDDMGYRTGYSYKNPVILQRKPRMHNDVEVPAYAYNPTSPLPEEIEEMRGALKKTEHSRWINSPNQYTRVVENVDEEKFSTTSSQNGDVSPRTKTKWKKSDDAKAASSVHITNPNQFVPTNTDPREVLQTRKSIRGQGRWELNRPGPQSQLLHGVTPDRSAPSDHVSTSSKGIIEKGHNIHVVSAAGPPNPFAGMSDDEIKQYRKNMLTENKPDSDNTEVKTELEAETSPAKPRQPSEEVVEVVAEPTPAVEESVPVQKADSTGVSPSHNSISSSECQSSPEKSVKGMQDAEEKAEDGGKDSEESEEVAMRHNGSSPRASARSSEREKKADKKKKRRSLSFLKKKKQKE
uniref:Alpha-adducin n=1 Tax=Phallusia mammillata TaxID=59560 RepID=A0A6F9D6M5_9ASCI|nr:alpha-adducin [Phallusia mammillata]